MSQDQEAPLWTPEDERVNLEAIIWQKENALVQIAKISVENMLSGSKDVDKLMKAFDQIFQLSRKDK
jgi:hypothetical protein